MIEANVAYWHEEEVLFAPRSACFCEQSRRGFFRPDIS